MKNLIDLQLEKVKKEKRLGFMTHVIVGYPSLNKTVSLVKTMADSGVDFVELQIPFSDPLADGPTIMKACETSLKNGTKVKDAFEIAKKLTKQVKIPLLFMAYFNTVFKYGTEKFCRDAKAAGISGLIIPDMPIEEEGSEGFMKYSGKNNLYIIRVLSPASIIERIKKNAGVAQGFVYFTARQGITGTQSDIDPKVADYLKQLKRYFKVPIAVGFGISSKEKVEKIRPYCNIAVVGSALINIIDNSISPEKAVKDFLKSIGVD